MTTDDAPPHETESATPPRSEPRRLVGQLLIATTVALILGVTLQAKTPLEANDTSRWCTVWSLVERGTYAIDECPWQTKTQDKVKKPDKLAPPDAAKGLLGRVEYAIAPSSWKTGEPTERYYSSKPPLLPTMIAGLVYPFRKLTGVPLDRVVEQERTPRWVEYPVEGEPGKIKPVLETPAATAKWPVNIFYFKPAILLLNLVPLLAFLVAYARLLDREAENDWSWFFGLFAASLGTYLLVFDQTLNNHTVAAWSAFFAVDALRRIWTGDDRSPARFVAAGLFGAFCACNELPAALFGIALFLMLLARFPDLTLKAFVPAAALVCGAFLVTQYLAFGQFKPVYEEFGTKSYEYYGSYWTTPLEMDWFNKAENTEPKGVYLFHMTLGHHGVFSLTPIFLFSLYGAAREIVRRGRLSSVAWLTLLLTVAMLAFYTWNPKARNYGGSTQGLRWLFWVIPFWLVMLPSGLAGGGRSRAARWLALATLFVSAMSVGYAMKNPWSHPWVLDAMEHLNLYTLKR